MVTTTEMGECSREHFVYLSQCCRCDEPAQAGCEVVSNISEMDLVMPDEEETCQVTISSTTKLWRSKI